MPRRPILALTVPEGLFAVAAVAVAAWPAATEPIADIVPYYRYAVLGVVSLLAWRFDRGRVLAALVVLVLADRTAFLDDTPATVNVIVLAAVPLLAWQSVVKEHGIFSRWTGVRVGAMVAIAAGLIALGSLAATWPSWLSYGVLPNAWTPLSAASIAVVLLAGCFLATRFWLDPNPLDRGLFWSVATMVVSLHFPAGSAEASLLLGTAGLVLGVAAVEDAYGLAYRDELTGLGSRRALERAMKRLPGRFSVAMVDVDRFKRLNDTHGHDVGDQVLRHVALRLRRTGGGGDVYRYGGEEFAILFPGRSGDEVMPHLEAARATVEAAPFKVRGPDRPKRRPKKPRAKSDQGRDLAVTVSIGLADAGTNHTTPAEVLKNADKALYRAKKKGRNRVIKNSS